VPRDYRKVVVEVCRDGLDYLHDVASEAIQRRMKPGVPSLENHDLMRAEVALGIVDALRHAYSWTVEDGHDQIEAHEYAEVERAFLRGPREETHLKRIGSGTVCAVYVDGDERNDFYLYCDLIRSQVWREIPDLIGRAAYCDEEE
jgi:hypothetical protein